MVMVASLIMIYFALYLECERGNMKPCALIVVISLSMIGCSKSPVQSASDTVQSAAGSVLAPLNPNDASKQAENMIRLIEDRPECDMFKQRLREAGKGPPAAGTTQVAILDAYNAAKAAGCRKP